MKIKVFQSDNGDCLLLETADGKLILVDGGMTASYERHVRKHLGKIRNQGKDLDVVYISHIDRDHILGVLKLLDDEVDWRIYEYQSSIGNHHAKKPKFDRPPEIKKIWHNSFHDQVANNRGRLDELYAASAEILGNTSDSAIEQILEKRESLALGYSDSIKVTNRLSADQLNIPVNPKYDRKLIMVRENDKPMKIGSMQFTVLGPFASELEALRKLWNEKLKESGDYIDRLRRKAKKDSERIGNSEIDRLMLPPYILEEQLSEELLYLSNNWGRDKSEANLSSIMFYAKDGDKTILLTGDGHTDDLLYGLEFHSLLDDEGKLEVTHFKVPHHGSKRNINTKFCEKVFAKNYIFCGNGAHSNPEVDVVELIFKERMKFGNDKFKFWFNSSSSESTDTKGGKEDMKKVERLVKTLSNKSNNRFSFEFVDGDYFEIE